MGLANAASRARNYGQTINRNQGGGDKKAGFPYQVGRIAWTAVAMGTDSIQRRCCSLRQLQITANPNVRQSRPAGSTVNVPYWTVVARS
jgi:hypothetical protein